MAFYSLEIQVAMNLSWCANHVRIFKSIGIKDEKSNNLKEYYEIKSLIYVFEINPLSTSNSFFACAHHPISIKLLISWSRTSLLGIILLKNESNSLISSIFLFSLHSFHRLPYCFKYPIFALCYHMAIKYHYITHFYHVPFIFYFIEHLCDYYHYIVSSPKYFFIVSKYKMLPIIPVKFIKYEL